MERGSIPLASICQRRLRNHQVNDTWIRQNKWPELKSSNAFVLMIGKMFEYQARCVIMKVSTRLVCECRAQKHLDEYMQHDYVIGSRLPTGELPRRMTQPCLHCLWPKRGRHLERTWWSPLATIAETSRRLKVADRAFQHNVMLEAVQNHAPDVLIMDEIGTSFCI